jgi:hypothetical protein
MRRQQAPGGKSVLKGGGQKCLTSLKIDIKKTANAMKAVSGGVGRGCGRGEGGGWAGG